MKTSIGNLLASELPAKVVEGALRMNPQKTAVLFPGQGACYPSALREIARHYAHQHVLSEVDEVARKRFGRTVSDLLWDPRKPALEQMLSEAPDLLQLAIYTISVSMFRVLTSEGLRPDLLMGHSLGEIAALACAGAFTVQEGAVIVCDRAEASQTAAGSGYMAALGTDSSTVERLVALVGNHTTVIAAENGHKQTVVSGTNAAMNRVSELAHVLQVGFTRLKSPYPFHSPLMEAAQKQFRDKLKQHTYKPLTLPVFSPILNRYYTETDSLADLLAEHLTQPVRFTTALERLHQEGVRTFVEAGALDALTKLTRKALSDKTVRAIAPLDGSSDEVSSVKKAIQELGITPSVSLSGTPLTSFLLAKNIPVEAHQPFWTMHGTAINQFISGQFQLFQAQSKPQLPITVAPLAGVSKSALPDRDSLFSELRTMYASALEYPEEVFAESTELEAELGIDSVKQTELLARVSEKYQLPPRTSDFRLGNYSTLGQVTDFVLAHTLGAAGTNEEITLSTTNLGAAISSTISNTANFSPAALTPKAEHPAKRSMSREVVIKEIVGLYAVALEYPEEVFAENIDLEAELGVDSVKQTELLGRVSEQYSLPPRDADFRLSNYNTIGKIADLVLGSASGDKTNSQTFTDGVHPAVLAEPSSWTASQYRQ